MGYSRKVWDPVLIDPARIRGAGVERGCIWSSKRMRRAFFPFFPICLQSQRMERLRCQHLVQELKRVYVCT